MPFNKRLPFTSSNSYKIRVTKLNGNGEEFGHVEEITVQQPERWFIPVPQGRGIEADVIDQNDVRYKVQELE